MIFCGCGILNELEPQDPGNCGAVPYAWGSDGFCMNVDPVCDRLISMAVLRGRSDS
jgi:spermidine/putrescine-binding protein